MLLQYKCVILWSWPRAKTLGLDAILRAVRKQGGERVVRRSKGERVTSVWGGVK